MNNIIEINNLEKSYNKKKIKVINKVNYKFKNGKIYSLIGPSGSGKSTLLNLLSLIDSPNSGTILVNNQKINFKEKNKNDQIRSNKIGIIYQDKNLLTDFTALENVYLARLNLILNKENAINDAKKIISKVVICKTADYWEEVLNKHHVPASKIRTLSEALDSEQIKSRALLQNSFLKNNFNAKRLPTAAFSYSDGSPKICLLYTSPSPRD